MQEFWKLIFHAERSAKIGEKSSAFYLRHANWLDLKVEGSFKKKKLSSFTGPKPLTTLHSGGNDSRADAAEASGLADVRHQVWQDCLFRMWQFAIAGYIHLGEVFLSVLKGERWKSWTLANWWRLQQTASFGREVFVLEEQKKFLLSSF